MNVYFYDNLLKPYLCGKAPLFKKFTSIEIRMLNIMKGLNVVNSYFIYGAVLILWEDSSNKKLILRIRSTNIGNIYIAKWPYDIQEFYATIGNLDFNLTGSI